MLESFTGNSVIRASVCCAALLVVGCGSDSDDGSFKPPTGTTVDLSGAVTTGPLPLADVDVTLFQAGSPDTPVSMATTNSAGLYTVAVLSDTPVSRSYDVAGFAVQNTLYQAFTTDTGGLDVDLTTDTVANSFIETAFPGLGFELVDKAWLAISIVDSDGEELGGITLTTDPGVENGGALDCDGLYSGSDTTIACEPARIAPMYLAYFDADAEIGISASDGAIIFSGSAPVRVGELTVLTLAR